MKRAIAIGCVVLGLALVGCTPKPSLVGKWKGEMDVQGQKVQADMEFKADGKLDTLASFDKFKVRAISSYTFEKDTLTTTADEVKVEGLELPPAAKAMFDQQMAANKGKKETATVVFKDADTVEVTSKAGEKMTWTRVK